MKPPNENSMDETRKESIRPLIQAWVKERLRSLQEQMNLTWEEGMGRLRPDDGLLLRILEAIGTGIPEGKSSDYEEIERDLGIALDLLEQSNNQGEVLRNLLQGLQPFVERSAIFVIKHGIVNLYAQRGFDIKISRNIPPITPPPELEDLIYGRKKSITRFGPAYKSLLEPLSRLEAVDILIVPLCLRRKPVAVLLADSGLRQKLDNPQLLRALTHATEAALSFQAASREERNDPASSGAVPQNFTTMQMSEPIPDEKKSSIDPRTRSNAERSARVLIGDIELYSPAKVANGKANKKLYELLKDDLERSRESFVERYGSDLEDNYQIFYKTLVQQLCDGDPSLLGPNPWSNKTR